MLTDLLSLEQLFGQENAALYVEELINRYGQESLNQAIESGHLVSHQICVGPDCGRCVCWLSDKGRYKALEFSYQTH